MNTHETQKLTSLIIPIIAGLAIITLALTAINETSAQLGFIILGLGSTILGITAYIQRVDIWKDTPFTLFGTALVFLVSSVPFWFANDGTYTKFVFLGLGVAYAIRGYRKRNSAKHTS